MNSGSVSFNLDLMLADRDYKYPTSRVQTCGLNGEGYGLGIYAGSSKFGNI